MIQLMLVHCICSDALRTVATQLKFLISFLQLLDNFLIVSIASGQSKIQNAKLELSVEGKPT